MEREIKFRFFGEFDVELDGIDKPIMIYGDVFAFNEYKPINEQFKINCKVMQFTGY